MVLGEYTSTSAKAHSSDDLSLSDLVIITIMYRSEISRIPRLPECEQNSLWRILRLSPRSLPRLPQVPCAGHANLMTLKRYTPTSWSLRLCSTSYYMAPFLPSDEEHSVYIHFVLSKFCVIPLNHLHSRTRGAHFGKRISHFLTHCSFTTSPSDSRTSSPFQRLQERVYSILAFPDVDSSIGSHKTGFPFHPAHAQWHPTLQPRSPQSSHPLHPSHHLPPSHQHLTPDHSTWSLPTTTSP